MTRKELSSVSGVDCLQVGPGRKELEHTCDPVLVLSTKPLFIDTSDLYPALDQAMYTRTMCVSVHCVGQWCC